MSSVALEPHRQPHQASASKRMPHGLRQTFWHRVPAWMQMGALAALVVGLLVDPRFAIAIERYALRFGSLSEVWRETASHAGVMLGMILAVAAIGMLGLLLQLVWGRSHQRSLWAWMRLMTLVCLWLVLGTQWAEIAWYGKQWRVYRETPVFASVVSELRANWPREDGDTRVTGPFMAYPMGAPRTLLLLTTPQLGESDTTFCAVERSPEGALRFQLAGAERGDWLEWHPAAGQPESFVGGLDEHYQLERCRHLGEGWYLVRYVPPTS